MVNDVAHCTKCVIEAIDDAAPRSIIPETVSSVSYSQTIAIYVTQCFSGISRIDLAMLPICVDSLATLNCPLVVGVLFNCIFQ